MIDSLGKLLIDPLAERWKNAAIGGSLVFWLALVGLALFTWPAPRRSNDWLTACHPAHAATRLLWCSLPPAGAAGAALAGGVAAVIATAFLVQALAPPFLVLVQGGGWRHWKLAWLPLKLQEHYKEIHTYRYPLKPGHLQPSRIGNSLAALTERVEDKLGYELPVIWDVLISSLPGDATGALMAKSRGIYLACQNMILCGSAIFAAVFVIPGGWAQILVPVVLFLLTICLWRSIGAATDDYCDLVLTMLILHRDLFYQALGEVPPQPGDDISQRGAALSAKVKDIVH